MTASHVLELDLDRTCPDEAVDVEIGRINSHVEHAISGRLGRIETFVLMLRHALSIRAELSRALLLSGWASVSRIANHQ